MNLSILVSVIPLSLLFAIPILIGVYVYKDAVQRGMNGALWALVVILTPGFIGLIIYLLVRNGYSRLQCPNCGTKVTEEYTLCPKCGTTLKAYCPSCRFPVED